MRRRQLLLGCCGAMAAGLFTGLAGCDAGIALSEGIVNPCRGTLPAELANHDLVHAAFEGIDAGSLWDAHVHLLGTGDSGSGCSVHPSMSHWWRPDALARRHGILNAACVGAQVPTIDAGYVGSLLAQTHAFPPGARWLLFAFDHAHDDSGRERSDWSTFHVPDEYAARVAREHADRFGWVASVHPYRADALERLDAALAAGACAIKWLPSAMNIDPRDARCKPFYERLARLDAALIVHFGEEKAAPGAGRHELNNPLLARAPLEHGVRVVMAHAGSLGHARDTDRSSAPRVASFSLFERLMNERRWHGRLYADISALFQVNRTAEVWRTVVRRDDWHARLLHGSDHPLPGVLPLFSPARLAEAGLLDATAVEPLRRLREHSALLFEFVLKRHLRDGSARLAQSVFATRRHFERRVATVGRA